MELITNKKKIILSIEFVLLFFGVPIYLLFSKDLLYPSSILIPLIIALIFYFRKQKNFKLKDLIIVNVGKKMWVKQLVVILILTVLMFAFVFFFDRENLFNLPRKSMYIWIAMFFFYPVTSAYGQEIIYRKFLFMRYINLFQKKWLLILASAVTFSFVHIVYFSVLSLILTFIAGIYMAMIYDKTKSVLFVSIIHGILGFIVFTIGLGQHFWIDMIPSIEYFELHGHWNYE